MARFGLIGGTYQSQSSVVDAEITYNWYPEAVESPGGKSQMALYPSPGLKVFASLAERSIPAVFRFNDRVFAASSWFYELFPDGTSRRFNLLTPPSGPMFIEGSENQLLICSAGQLWVFTLATNTLTPVNMDQFGGLVSQIGYSDGSFIALQANSQILQSSALLDGTTWPGLNITQVSMFPDNITGFIVDHRELWIGGNKKSVVYYNAGNLNFPFSPIPGVFIEQGWAAQAATVRLDNSIFWIGQDERGKAMAWRASGYNPQRVSNHGIENVWASYPTVSDAIGYGFQWKGHSFWHIYFPSANASWRYDVATGLWHNVSFWDATNAQTMAHRSMSHCLGFGKHLVGDPFSGNIYDMSDVYNDDFGNAIRRVRRSPTISTEEQWIFHRLLQIDVEAGLGTFTTQTGTRGPQIMVRWSDDGAKTWSDEHWIDCGQQGQYKTRAILRRLGRSRKRIYEIVATDPVPWRIAEGYLDADPGFGPQERLSRSLSKMA